MRAMRVWVISDLHLEFGGLWVKPSLGGLPYADVCVVAGDVTTGCDNSVHWLAKMIGGAMPVVFVAGNHEFYGGSILEGAGCGKEAAMDFPNVHFLDDSTVEIGGVRFVGATLWTDYALDGDAEVAMAAACQQMNDHRRIVYRSLPVREPFTPQIARTLHRRSRHWLKRELQKPFEGPTVVVTHHAPHPQSIGRAFKGSALNPCFASDLTDVITRWQPQLWVHGHMHNSVDYAVGDTRVVCNPRGYEGENAAFDPWLIIDLET